MTVFVGCAEFVSATTRVCFGDDAPVTVRPFYFSIKPRAPSESPNFPRRGQFQGEDITAGPGAESVYPHYWAPSENLDPTPSPHAHYEFGGSSPYRGPANSNLDRENAGRSADVDQGFASQGRGAGSRAPFYAGAAASRMPSAPVPATASNSYVAALPQSYNTLEPPSYLLPEGIKLMTPHVPVGGVSPAMLDSPSRPGAIAGLGLGIVSSKVAIPATYPDEDPDPARLAATMVSGRFARRKFKCLADSKLRMQY